MPDSIIKVENLGKKYRIRHQQDGQRYVAMRDVITEKLTAPWRWLSEPRAKRNGHSDGSKEQGASLDSSPLALSTLPLAQSPMPLPPSSSPLALSPLPQTLSALPLPLTPLPAQEDFWALRNVSFEVKQGEVVGIIGRNGAGKSTLLKILSRITEPTEGRVRLRGRVASLLEVGTGFHPELTGRENIYLNGAVLGMTRAEIRKKFDEIIAFAEVEKFLDTPVKRYSSGMYVRLAFAIAAHLEPEILVVDEVLAVGDAEFQKKCLGKMSEVSRGGRTVLFVSHNMNAVKNLCSRGVLVIEGQLYFDGSIDRTIVEYTQTGSVDLNLSWKRPDNLSCSAMAFNMIRVILEGQQPQLQLKCFIVLHVSNSMPSAFIAVDICDQLQVPIMQALPVAKPFIPGSPGIHHLSLEIDLPPLIPGRYLVDFWIGPHFSSTADYVKNVVAFEVSETPSSNRSWPHSSDHGFLVPPSRCSYSSD